MGKYKSGLLKPTDEGFSDGAIGGNDGNTGDEAGDSASNSTSAAGVGGEATGGKKVNGGEKQRDPWSRLREQHEQERQPPPQALHLLGRGIPPGHRDGACRRLHRQRKINGIRRTETGTLKGQRSRI